MVEASHTDGEGARGRQGLAWIPFVILSFGALILGMVLWQCGSSSTAEASELGLAQFRRAGCASCHGATGEGRTAVPRILISNYPEVEQ